MRFYGLISKLMVVLIKEELYRRMFYCFKKSENKIVTTRGLFIGAMFHVKLIAKTRVNICHKNMKSVWISSQFFKSFRGKIYKKIFYRKWRMDWVWSSNNYKWLCTLYCIITWAFHKLTCRQNQCIPQKTNNTFIFL